MKNNIIGFGLLGLLILALVFAALDGIKGSTHRFPAVITGHRYVAPWTETQVSVDSDGHTSITTVDHPAEYHLYCIEVESDGEAPRTYDIDQQSRFDLPDGTPVTVAARVGHWTKARWFPSID